MSFTARLRALARGTAGRRGMESSMDQELRFHRETYAADLVRRGLSHDEAERRARREFGAIEPLKEECRQALGLRLVDEAAQDLRYAFRSFRRSPGFCAVAILTLAIGLGANTAIFTLVDRWVLRPLPFPDPDRLLVVNTRDLKTGGTDSTSSADLLDWRAALTGKSFDAICGWNHANATLTGSGEAEAADAMIASAEFLPMLGVKPIAGRLLDASDEKPAARRTAVISFGMWRRRFGGNPAAIGRSLIVNGEPVTVAGVLPAEFHFALAGNIDLFLPPVWSAAERSNRKSQHWNIVARVRSSASVEQANAALRAVAASLAAEHPETNRNRGVHVRSLHDEIGRTSGNEPALGVFALVGCVLLIACFNVANLQLGRAVARQKEISVRLGIGAGRARIVRQLLTENVALFLAGAAASPLVAMACTNWLANAIPPMIRPFLPNRGQLTVDGRALLYALAVAGLTGIAFGLAPALALRRLDVNRGLKDSAARLSGSRFRAALVVAEVALATLVLVSAGLLAEGILRLYGDAPGFDPHGVSTAQLFASRRTNPAARAALFDAIVERLSAFPGIEAAAAGTQVPYFDEGDSFTYRTAASPSVAHTAAFSAITPDYFRVLHIPLLRGRGFSDGDAAGAPLAAVVNRTMARRAWPDRDSIGQQFSIDADFRRVFTVVGVVGDTMGNNDGLAPGPEFYVPQRQMPSVNMTILARAISPARNLAPEIRRAVAQADPLQAVTLPMTMEEAIDVQRAQYSILSQLTAAFALVAMLLAAIGIYGVTAYAVNARRREFGIRLALGARRGEVVGLALRRYVALAMAGLAVGLIAAAATTRYLVSMLYGVKVTDAPTYAAMSLLLATVAVCACYLPARRAARANFSQLLREE